MIAHRAFQMGQRRGERGVLRDPGAEAGVRYGRLLRMTGRNAEARVVFNELLLQMKRAPKYLREAQAEWLSIAEKQLSS